VVRYGPPRYVDVNALRRMAMTWDRPSFALISNSGGDYGVGAELRAFQQRALLRGR